MSAPSEEEVAAAIDHLTRVLGPGLGGHVHDPVALRSLQVLVTHMRRLRRAGLSAQLEARMARLQLAKSRPGGRKKIPRAMDPSALAVELGDDD